MTLKTVLVIMLKEIYDVQTSSPKPNLSEEFKLSVIRCFEMAFRVAQTECIEEFYVEQNRIIAAQILNVCVDIIAKENYRKLR